MYSKDDHIAVFDSGVGGISVLRHLRKLMPQENFIYFGDSANAPYGTRTTGEVRQLTLAAAQLLLTEYPVKALVVACNTATAAAITLLREQHPDLIVIGIEPALSLAARLCPGGRIGVMATPVTLREEKFDHLLHRFQDCRVTPLPTPGLVELVEQGKGEGPEARAYLTPLLAPYAGKLDAVVLGCTHFPFAARTIASILGEKTMILDGGEGTARETQRRLGEQGLLREGGGSLILRNSAGDSKMDQLMRRLAGEEIYGA